MVRTPAVKAKKVQKRKLGQLVEEWSLQPLSSIRTSSVSISKPGIGSPIIALPRRLRKGPRVMGCKHYKLRRSELIRTLEV